MSAVLTDQELATVLAALRHWQNVTEARPHFAANFDHFTDVAPLTADQIDELCMRINVPSTTAPAPKHAELLAWLTEISRAPVDKLDDDDVYEYLRTAKRIAKGFVKELKSWS